MKSAMLICFLLIITTHLFVWAAPGVVSSGKSHEHVTDISEKVTNVWNDLDAFVDIIAYVMINIIWGFYAEDYVLKLGYPMLETDFVRTVDGYQLPLVRIRHKRHEDVSTHPHRPPVLVMHGISGSSDELLSVGLNKSLVLQLVDQGYDVYIGNNRGNKYSENTQWHKSDPRYWDFSFDDMATKDLPAIIDAVLSISGYEKLTYVGYSQGATEVIALLATKPEYSEKFLLVNALAPLVYMGNVSSQALQFAADHEDLIEKLRRDNEEIFQYNPELSLAMGTLCLPSLNYSHCPKALYAIAGYSPEQFDWYYLPLFFETYPAGLGLKTLLHYVQEVRSGLFRKFDYGKDKNVQIYGQPSPPQYNISNIAAPLAVFYGKTDALATVPNVERFVKELPAASLVHQQLINSEYFNHFDFLAGKDVYNLVNVDVINLINKYNGKTSPTN